MMPVQVRTAVVVVVGLLFVLLVLLVLRWPPRRNEEKDEMSRALLRRATALLTQGEGTDDPRIRRIRERWDFGITSFRRNSPEDPIAHSTDKQNVSLCLHETDPNTAFFVLLHELAHIATPERGHTPTFWDNFRVLLHLATRKGLFVPLRRPSTMCGKPIKPFGPR